MSTPDEHIAAQVDGTAWFDRKLDALRAHRSQIAADSFFVNAPGEAASQFSVESFRLAAGTPFPAGAPADDLFVGIG